MKNLMAYIAAASLEENQLIELAVGYQNKGIDELFVADFTTDEAEREEFLEKARALSRAIDIPFTIGTYAHRFEDTKKAFYTGASAVVLRECDVQGTEIVKESTDRFGADKIFVMASDICENGKNEKIVILKDNSAKAVATALAGADTVKAAAELADMDIMQLKREAFALGAEVNTFSPAVSFDELKLGADGLIPCIVQDYKTNEVLMMAYMDREAFEKTAETGIMTYHSRSRNELWIKGETSGHYQFVRELSADCDKDTLLAKVVQIGVACHTGSYSCFFNEIIKHEFETKDISKVLASLYAVVVDRKLNPKEGSYTNYLFNKGIDKILKKCGEEATEMVIAAKNPNAEELKYEIADLLYHMTVLMVECGVDWQDVAGELANR